MLRRPIYKHAGTIVKVKKEKEEKKGAKKATTQQASKQCYYMYYPMGMRQTFMSLRPKREFLKVYSTRYSQAVSHPNTEQA